jgi:hypothetical protein
VDGLGEVFEAKLSSAASDNEPRMPSHMSLTCDSSCHLHTTRSRTGVYLCFDQRLSGRACMGNNGRSSRRGLAGPVQAHDEHCTSEPNHCRLQLQQLARKPSAPVLWRSFTTEPQPTLQYRQRPTQISQRLLQQPVCFQGAEAK